MEEDKIIKPLIENLEKQFALESPRALPSAPSIAIIKEALVKKITELMANDYQKFLNGLYMLDINEDKLTGALYTKNKQDVPSLIADLIIERQIQKVTTRQMYKNGLF